MKHTGASEGTRTFGTADMHDWVRDAPERGGHPVPLGMGVGLSCSPKNAIFPKALAPT